jgi:hypothetical protein
MRIVQRTGCWRLEECEAPTVFELVHRVAELVFLPAHQVLDFGPRGDERQADNVLVEFSGGLLIGGHKGVVVQPHGR